MHSVHLSSWNGDWETRTLHAATTAHGFASLNHDNEKIYALSFLLVIDYRLHEQSGGNLGMELNTGQSNTFKCKKINADLVSSRISAKLHLQRSN